MPRQSADGQALDVGVVTNELDEHRAHRRVHLSAPGAGAPAGGCVVVQSGRLGPANTPSPESRLAAELAGRLAAAGVSTLRLDMPSRDDMMAPATASHLEERSARLEACLSDGKHAELLSRHVLVGFSLGAQSVLRVLANPRPAWPVARGAVLVGCVIEEPIVVMAGVAEVALVYGSRDHIAYHDGGGGMKGARPIAPEEYAPVSARRLVLRPAQRRSVHILGGFGHLLTDTDTAGRFPAAQALTDLVVTVLKAGEAARHEGTRV